MKYNLEVSYPTHNDEWDIYSQEFATLQECVDYAHNHIMKYHGFMSDVTINGKKIRVRNGKLFGSDYEPFCTNQSWHDIFADDSYPRITGRCNNPSTLETMGVKL